VQKSILIVDDDPFVVEMLKDVLTLLGIQVKIARNGRDALEMLATEKPTCAIIDLMMPVMDGFTLIHSIRREPAGKDLPLIVLSGLGHQARVEERLPGVVGAIVKNRFNIVQLCKLLCQAGVLTEVPPAFLLAEAH
jgi:CheY-like chemotaxis protein